MEQVRLSQWERRMLEFQNQWMGTFIRDAERTLEKLRYHDWHSIILGVMVFLLICMVWCMLF